MSRGRPVPFYISSKGRLLESRRNSEAEEVRWAWRREANSRGDLNTTRITAAPAETSPKHGSLRRAAGTAPRRNRSLGPEGDYQKCWPEDDYLKPLRMEFSRFRWN